MYNGIKPTRLWHLTCQKRFRRMILDRECAQPPHVVKRHFLEVVGATILSGLGVMAMYGRFMPQPAPPDPTKTKCDTSKSKKTCKPPKEPCPPKDEKKMKPCKAD